MRASLISLGMACVVIAGVATAQADLKFRPPVLVMAGEKAMGVDRMYPSPIAVDLDGDGVRDYVVGDLRGRLTVALGVSGNDPTRLAEEKPVLATDGKPIDFHNW